MLIMHACTFQLQRHTTAGCLFHMPLSTHPDLLQMLRPGPKRCEGRIIDTHTNNQGEK